MTRDTEDYLSGRSIAFWLLAAALLNAGPLFFTFFIGDNYTHHTLITCFSEDFWRGNFYPQWCMQAHGGTGTPALYFYFPLPYYIAALVYPLHWLGFSLFSVFHISVLLASVTAAFTGYYWLRGQFSARVALFGAVLYLFLPYRLELLGVRAAYAELWCLSFLPLMLHYARGICQRQPKSLPLFSLWMSACLLCHVPATLAALFAVVVVTVILSLQSRRLLQNLSGICCGVLIALSLTAFYSIPALLLSRYVDLELKREDIRVDKKKEMLGWPNGFVSLGWSEFGVSQEESP